MHIVLAVFALLGFGLFWWYRLKMLNEAADDIIDGTGRLRGYFRRRRIRLQAEHSPLTAIEDPILAAATLIFAIIAEDVLITDDHIDVVRSVIFDISSPKKADEAMIYAKWAFGQIGDTAIVIEKVAPYLRQQLTELEKCELIDMVDDAACAVAVSQRYGQRVRKLKQRLGLQVD
jgi:hypothetical protein